MNAKPNTHPANYLELIDIQKRFAAFTAVEKFDLKVSKGEFVTFLGPSGCGKTTVLRMIAGFEQPTNGQLILNGRDLTNVPANKRNIGMVFQSYALFPNMNAADNVGFGLRIAGQSSSAIKKRVGEMLDLIRMTEFAGRFPHQLSGGQQQRVSLARALAIQPDVLLLDEPLSALDAKIRVALRQEIRSIQRQLGITTIFVTHDQEEALTISDRIVVMSKGRIEQVGTPSAIYNAPGTRFVASFVGTLNVLSARQTTDHGYTVDDQPLPIDGVPADSVRDGMIAVALRPEALKVIDAAQNGVSPNGGSTQSSGHLMRWNGTVEDIAFLGSVVRTRVRLHDQFVHVDAFNNPGVPLPTFGSPVQVTFPREAVTVLRGE